MWEHGILSKVKYRNYHFFKFQGEDTLSDIVAEIRQEVQEIFQEFTEAEAVSIGDVEAGVSAKVGSWGQRLSEAILCEKATATEVSPNRIACRSCQGQSRRYRCRGRNFTTLCGVVRVFRWEYKCKCGAIDVPWEARQGLKGRYTQRVSETMMRFAAQLNYRAATSELKHHGIEVSHTTLHQKVRQWGSGEDVSDYVDEQSLEAGARWYVSCDGCHTNSHLGWKEVKVGSLCKDYPHTHATSVIKARSTSLRYVATRDTAADFGHHLSALATQTGIYQDEPPLDTQEVVIGDGAAWIWNLADEHFPNATEILDYMHAKAHLYDIAKKAFGEENTQTLNAWVDATETPLYNGQTSKVVARLRALGTENPTIPDIVEREVDYFEKHAHRMQYRDLSENGYQIGSGVIESACKHVVAERCKQAGMRWSKPGINAILFWRCLLKNGTWHTYWDTQVSPEVA